MLKWVFVCAAGAVAVFTGTGGASAQAQVEAADYSSDFVLTTDPAARNGWSYWWNANGAIGNPANYQALGVENGQYEPIGTPAGAGALGIGSAPVDPAKFAVNPPTDPFGFGITLPPLPSTYVRPGLGSVQDASNIERSAIIAYTFTAEEIAAASGGGTSADAYITDYYFATSTSGTDVMVARLYKGTDPVALPFPPFPPGFAFQTMLDPDPIFLGTFTPGETLYVAIGGGPTDTGDEMRLDLTLSLVPEPVGLPLLGLTALAALGGRRRGRQL
jgi:hypothetical protein